jgi:hypothetical protein
MEMIPYEVKHIKKVSAAEDKIALLPSGKIMLFQMCNGLAPSVREQSMSRSSIEFQRGPTVRTTIEILKNAWALTMAMVL